MSIPQDTRTWARVHNNSTVRVKLNAKGLAEYERQRIELRGRMPAAARHRMPLEPHLDAEGYYRTELWGLMQGFGHMMQAGAEPPWDGEMLIEEVGHD